MHNNIDTIIRIIKLINLYKIKASNIYFISKTNSSYK